eukprot:scaffold125970_cov57-Phaeocystis_antarctica.AAC.1
MSNWNCITPHRTFNIVAKAHPPSSVRSATGCQKARVLYEHNTVGAQVATVSEGELYWGSGTLKIGIPVENHPQKPENRLADDHPLGGGC